MKNTIQEIIDRSLSQARGALHDGRVADYIPELGKADPRLLGVCVATADGSVYEAGNARELFTMQSISKTCSLILALQTAGYETVFGKVGMEPTGDRFDSILQLETKDWRPFNPLINSGAIVIADCIHTADPFQSFLTLVRRLCGNPTISMNDAVYLSESQTSARNRSIAYLLKSTGVLDGRPEDVLDIYFRFCSVMVSARDLAHYALVLACGGQDPHTGKQIVEKEIVQTVLTLMLLCGMYDESGTYAVQVGMPSKSGVGGGILAVGRNVGIGTFGPMLNQKGTSIGGLEILRTLSKEMKLHLFSNL